MADQSTENSDAHRFAAMLDEIAEYCGMISLQAGIARDNAIAADPIAVKYNLRRLSAYLRASIGLLSDIDKIIAAEDRVPDPVLAQTKPISDEDFWS